jgi:hypothetical protein
VAVMVVARCRRALRLRGSSGKARRMCVRSPFDASVARRAEAIMDTMVNEADTAMLLPATG